MKTVINALLVLEILLYSAGLRAEQPKEVRIACNVPLTGDLSVYGTAVQEGIALALADIGGAGPELVFDWQDNRGEPKEAVTVMRRQLLNGPDLYMSGVHPQTIAIRDQVAARKIPHFVWIFDIHIRPHGEAVFRNNANFKVEPPLLLDYARRRRARKVAIIYVQLAHTDEEYRDVIIPGLRNEGREVLVEPYDIGKTSFDDLALRAKAFKPDLLVLSGFQANLLGMVRALNRLQLLKDGNAIASYDLIDAAPLLKPEEIEGLRVTTPAFLLRVDEPRIKAWFEKFRARYHKDPLYAHAYAYDVGLIMADAARRMPGGRTPELWAKVLGETDIEGITGRLKFDAEGDVITPVEVGVFRNGRLVEDGSAGVPAR